MAAEGQTHRADSSSAPRYLAEPLAGSPAGQRINRSNYLRISA